MRLIRVSSTGEGTFGVLEVGGYPFCVTLENPWMNNAPFVSCIPAGVYNCRRVDSPRFGDTFEVADVEGRSHVVFHEGNTMKDTHGCILLGKHYGMLEAEHGILASKITRESFMSTMDGLNEVILTITDAPL